MKRLSLPLLFLALLPVGVLVAPAAPAAAASILQRAQGTATCDKFTIDVLGRAAPGTEVTLEFTLTLTPLDDPAHPITKSGSFTATANNSGRFRTFEHDYWGRKLCGRSSLEGTVTLVGGNTVTITWPGLIDNILVCCCGAIGDFVWNDLDRDGIQDPGEPGLEGVLVLLYDAAGNFLGSDTTDANGAYRFSGLCAGLYLVDVDESTLPPGFEPTAPGQGGNPATDSNGPLDGSPAEVTLATDKSLDATIDFGYQVPCSGSLGDLVWLDLDQNGLQSLDEPGIEGVTVLLLDANGATLASTVTDAGGIYGFGGLCAGTYGVQVDATTLPAGLAPTLANVGGDDAVDSDPSPIFTLLATDDATDTTLDFGYGNCDECKGGVLAMSLVNEGPGGFVEVLEDDGDLLFSGDVASGETFTFTGVGSEKMNNGIAVLVDGVEDAAIHTSCSQPLGPGLVFGSFRVVSVKSKDNGLVCPLVACAVSTVDLTFGSKDMKWKVANDGDGVIHVSRVVVTWPAANGSLKKVKLGGEELYTQLTPPPALDLGEDAIEVAFDKRKIDPGNDEELKFEFEFDISQDETQYSIRVEFAEGCALDFVPGPGGGGTFDCSKPIDALTMIWDGASAVRTKAWKGAVGSTLLADIDDIQIGQEVTVTGFAGSPNDVTWELFVPGTLTKTGESQFHLSCSDSEMDGADDCGRREGNGKSNDASLVNDWLFEGMVDSDETLDCTP